MKIRISIRKYWFFALTTILLNCEKVDNNPSKDSHQEIKLEYGRPNILHQKQTVNLNIANFDSYRGLINTIQDLNCDARIPVIKIEREKNIRTFYLKDACLERYSCILIKYRNIIEIYKDSIYKSGKFYPSNELSEVLKKDYNNYGKIPSWSEKPNKVIVYLSLWDDEIGALEEKLVEISDAYQKLNTSHKLNF